MVRHNNKAPAWQRWLVVGHAVAAAAGVDRSQNVLDQLVSRKRKQECVLCYWHVAHSYLPPAGK